MTRSQDLHPLTPPKTMCTMTQGIFCLCRFLFSLQGLCLWFGLNDTNLLFTRKSIITSLQSQRSFHNYTKASCDYQSRQGSDFWKCCWPSQPAEETHPGVRQCSSTRWALRLIAYSLLRTISIIITFFLSLETMLHKYSYAKNSCTCCF